MKKIAILGSTGSIGKSTLDVVSHLQNTIQVKALACHSNIALISDQIKKFQPDVVCVYQKDKADILKTQFPHLKVLSGIEGLKEVATLNTVDMVLSAMSGTLGLIPTIAAIENGKDVALANKEVLVAAGEYVMSLVNKKGIKLIPVDSEHSAIFQCLNGENKENIERIILTASGGPFRDWPIEKLHTVTVDDALKHPTWAMGQKITVDSSTMMNKGLEVIEAHHLFQLSLDKIEVVIHPESIIHSLVEYVDGSMLAQLSEPDMRLPIQYALTYPERANGITKKFDFKKNYTLNFIPPKKEKFRCLTIAYEALRLGKSYPCFLNAANEVLVHRFLTKEISWWDIAIKLEKILEKHQAVQLEDLESILAIDRKARDITAWA